MSESFQPEVIAFCCRHCAYAAADLAGGTRQPYPTAIKIVELPCTGRIDVVTMLHAFEKGADGILVAGCLSGRCHYLKGNLYARQRIEHLGSLLTEIGLEPQRARMINISAAMAVQFAQLASEHVETVRALGPSPLREAQKGGMEVAGRSYVTEDGHRPSPVRNICIRTLDEAEQGESA